MRAAVQGLQEIDHGKRNAPHLVHRRRFMTVVLGGCSSYIRRAEFDTTIAELRATDQRLQGQIEALSQKHDALVTRSHSC